MLRCNNCETYFEEKELVRIQLGDRDYYVCPDCLKAFLEEMDGMISSVPEEEEEEIKASWKADELYDEGRLGKAAI